MNNELIEIIYSPWWYQSDKYENHIILNFPTRHPNQQNVSYLDPIRNITLGDPNILSIDGVSYSIVKPTHFNFRLNPE